MVAYERVFFFHTYRVLKLRDELFLFQFRKVDFTSIEKIIRYFNSASKSLVCSKRTNRKQTPNTP